MSALEVTNVSVRYGNIVGTQGVSFKLNAGETIAHVDAIDHEENAPRGAGLDRTRIRVEQPGAIAG